MDLVIEARLGSVKRQRDMHAPKMRRACSTNEGPACDAIGKPPPPFPKLVDWQNHQTRDERPFHVRPVAKAKARKGGLLWTWPYH